MCVELSVFVCSAMYVTVCVCVCVCVCVWQPTTVGSLCEEYVLCPKPVKTCYLMHVLSKIGPGTINDATEAAAATGHGKHKHKTSKGKRGACNVMCIACL